MLRNGSIDPRRREQLTPWYRRGRTIYVCKEMIDDRKNGDLVMVASSTYAAREIVAFHNQSLRKWMVC